MNQHSDEELLATENFFFSALSIDETDETSRVACAVGIAELSKARESKEQLVTLNEDRKRETDVSGPSSAVTSCLMPP